MHSSVVAHQCFALKTLSWLGQIIQYSGTSGPYYPCLSLCGMAETKSRFWWKCCYQLLPLSNVLDGLRRILCQVGLQSGPQGGNSSLVDQLMLNDSKMWKGIHIHTQTVSAFIKILVNDKFVIAGARNIYHQLLMNSFLMDLKYKKIFAVQFAKVSHLSNTYIFNIPPVLATKLFHHHQCTAQYAWSAINKSVQCQ